MIKTFLDRFLREPVDTYFTKPFISYIGKPVTTSVTNYVERQKYAKQLAQINLDIAQSDSVLKRQEIVKSKLDISIKQSEYFNELRYNPKYTPSDIKFLAEGCEDPLLAAQLQKLALRKQHDITLKKIQVKQPYIKLESQDDLALTTTGMKNASADFNQTVQTAKYAKEGHDFIGHALGVTSGTTWAIKLSKPGGYGIETSTPTSKDMVMHCL